MMNKQITDEMTGIGYTLRDGYSLPDFALPAEGEQSIGIWGCGSPAATSAGGRSTDRAGRREAGRRWRPSSAGLRSASVGPGRVPPGRRTRAGCDAAVRYNPPQEPAADHVPAYEQVYQVYRTLYPALRENFRWLAEL